MIDISKRFPGVQALERVTFDVRAGEVHALVGENGAGKSTLMKILAGVYHADSGQIIFRGQPASFTNPYDARAHGIGTIYQELMLVQYLTVAENIFLGKVPLNRLGWVDRKKMVQEARRLLQRLELGIDPTTFVSDLPVAMQQMVEIAKALSFEAELIIMDEPTSALSQHEIEVLFGTIERLRAEGRGVIFISHKLEEIFRLANRVTVLRDGRHVATQPVSEMTETQLVQMMVGRDLTSFFAKTASTLGGPILRAQGLSRRGQFYDVSFTLHSGEILGLAGLVGAGRTDVARAIFGAEDVDRGEVYLAGQRIPQGSPRAAIKAGIGFVTEDRKLQSLFLPLSVLDNVVMPKTETMANAGVLDAKAERKLTHDFVQRLEIKTPSLAQEVSNLSGGNQQKVVLARWLAIGPKVLIVDEPTRGIDVGAKAEIHAILSRLAASGVGILLISSEMNEILALSDRILVMRDGRIVGEFSAERATQEAIAACALGLDYGH